MKESSRLHPALGRVLAAAQPRMVDPELLRPLGVAAVDQVLGGGLLAGAPHELFAREDSAPGDDASVMGFAVMLALRLLQGPETGAGAAGAGSVLWLREEQAQRRAGLCGPGLVELGLDPARVILGVLPDAKAVLRAGADALGCVGLGVVILELHGNPALLDLTASRRLALSAERSGVTPLLLRLKGARPAPSAARTRWAVGAAPSLRLEADAPGLPALAVTLLRQRGGPAGLDWELEWDRDRFAFKPAALSRARLPLSGGGPRPLAGAAGEREPGDGWRIAG